ncbi:hypothetical protein PTKIN_Ptkin09bG0246600 [Pterospermum kingtungense]
MGVYLVFFFILLLQPATSQAKDRSAGCNERCGNLTIPYPFGIKTGCYTNSWFKVTCNETAHGPKPFISSINLELLGSFSLDGYVVVNNPVTYLNCSTNFTAPASVNLQGTPFYFPSKYNMFRSVGCGNCVAALSNIQDEAVANCLQVSCGGFDPNLGEDYCFTEISEDLVSYTATKTEIIDPRKLEQMKRYCTSAFIFTLDSWISDDEFSYRISLLKTHVPAVLKWNPVKCGLEGQ